MKECLDVSILQTYFDGELSAEEMSAAAGHLAICQDCAMAAREVEEEMLILASAFAIDDSIVVPTERLHERITAAINATATAQPVYLARPQNTFFASLRQLFNFNFQQPLAYGLASALLLALMAGWFFLIRQNQTPVNEISRVVSPVNTPDSVVIPTVENNPTNKTPVDAKIDERKPTVIRHAKFVAPPVENVIPPVVYSKPQQVKLLPGEKSYLKAIVELKSKIDTRAETLRPETRIAYERNLAVVDQAIASSRMAAQHDPRDTDANSLLLSAYQSKVELLSAVAGQNQTPFEAR